MQDDSRFTIRELADATGVSDRTIRYYIQQGLLTPPNGRGRAAYYTTAHVAQLAHITALRNKRRTHDEIRELVTAPVTAQEAAGEAWMRIRLHDDLELHVRADAPEQIRAMATRLRDIVDEWLYGGEPE